MTMNKLKQGAWRRKLRASWRDTWLLMREFRWPLTFFGVAIIGGGALYFNLASLAGEASKNLGEAMYQVLGMTFFQPIGDFPRAWYLEVFYFIMPVIGIGIFAHGFAEFGVLFFNRRARGKEWEMAVASTFNNHIILVGLGHLGYRVVRNLHLMNQDVVVIEMNPKADLVSSVRKLGVPVLEDDAVRETTIEAAGVARARSIVLCTQNDSLNLQVALKARSINPLIHVIVRIFDDDFALALKEQFGFTAMSATGMAAPAFAAIAAGTDMTSPITVDGQAMSLARMTVDLYSLLPGMTVGDVEGKYNLSVVLVRDKNGADQHPAAARKINAGDVLAVFGGPVEIGVLTRDNCPGR
ncbi:MAG: hypothetical protein EHM70_06405 [Chloroflexota bacterium]|nr:MAG: hypothetical protein EHM70_06405 [Chloroflexota bacterium]